MDKSISEIAKIASEWWADKVVNPKFDNGDSGIGEMFASKLASLNTKPVDDKARERFISHLSNTIEKNLGDYDFILSVDYAPDKSLYEAGEFAGISRNNFPWKTTMWMSKNHISVSYGYRGNNEILYANKSHWKKLIDRTEESIEEYRSGRMLSWIENEDDRKETAKQRISDLERKIGEYKIEIEKAEY